MIYSHLVVQSSILAILAIPGNLGGRLWASAEDSLRRLLAQNVFQLLLLIAAQRRAEDGASVTAELFRHFVGVGGAQKRVDR